MERIKTVDGIVALLQDKNIRVEKADLFGYCKATVKKQGEGYLILVEETLSFDAMLKALQHELCHIILGHLDDDTKTESQMEKEVTSVLPALRHELKRVGQPATQY